MDKPFEVVDPVEVPGIGQFHSYTIDDAATRANFMIYHGIDPVEIKKKYGAELKNMLDSNRMAAAQATSFILYRQIANQINELNADLNNCMGCGKPHHQHETHRTLPHIVEGVKVCKMCGKPPELHHPSIQRIKAVELLRMAEQWLKNVIAFKDGNSRNAQALLRDLYLECTTPWNEVISPGWKDSYTNVPFPKDEEVFVEQTNWNHYVVNKARELYPHSDAGSLEQRRQWIEANQEFTGTEEMLELDEDRGFLPDHMRNEFEITSGWELRAEIRDMCVEAQEKINARLEKIDQVKTRLDYHRSHSNYAAMKRLKGKIPHERMKIHGIKVNTALDINKRMDQWRFDHPIQDILVGLSVAHEWFVNLEDLSVNGQTLMQFSEDNPEILERINTGGAFSEGELPDGADEYLLEQVLSTYPVTHAETTMTRAWNEGYIRAVINGAPIDGDQAAHNKAWDYYRSSISKDGQAAFIATLKDKKKTAGDAWRTFYAVARGVGKVWDVPDHFTEHALVTRLNIGGTYRKTIKWERAAEMLEADQLQIDLERARTALESKSWGGVFLQKIIEKLGN